MHLFGLTGGIASGKSAVATQIRALGIPVIDADMVAREVVAPGTQGFVEIVARFGPSVVTSAGDLDRKALGAIVFASESARKDLNRITHPRIASRTLELSAELASQGHKLACYEAALIVENGMQEAFRPLIVVWASPAIQRERLIKRDGLSEQEADARIAAQLPLDQKKAVANYLIENNGTLSDLATATNAAIAKIRTSLSSPQGAT